MLKTKQDQETQSTYKKLSTFILTQMISKKSIAVGFFMVYFSYLMRNNIIGNWLSGLLGGGIMNFITVLLNSFGGALISIGLVKLIWDKKIREAWKDEVSDHIHESLWNENVRKSWKEEVRENILQSLCEPETVNRYALAWQKDVMQKLLCNFSGEKIGKKIYENFNEKLFELKHMRERFDYTVNLTDGITPGFYNANFHIEYRTHFTKSQFNVRMKVNNDSMNIHDNYQSLFTKHMDDIYRYILFIGNKGDEDTLGDLMSVSKCIISLPNDPENNIELISSSLADDVDGTKYISLYVPDEQKTKFENFFEGKICDIYLEVNSFVDKSWCYFPIVFLYPIEGFRTRFEIFNSPNQHDIKIVNFFTPAADFKRSTNISSTASAAGGETDDIILPGGGVAYVWKNRP